MSEITKPRPKFLALNEIILPLPGKVSILHRVSGAGLFLFLPFLIYMLQLSLADNPQSAELFAVLTGNVPVKLIIFGLSWAYLHHFCAGIRYLFLDMHIGLDKASAYSSARTVLLVSLALTALVAWKLFGGH